MKQYYTPLIILVLFTISAFMQTKAKKVIFFGDSITQMGVNPGGYISMIRTLASNDKVADQFEFIGKGIGGNKIYDLYLRLEEDVLNHSPDVVVIYIGINDIWHKRGAATGTDIDKFEKFYLALINKMKEKNIRVVLCTPTVIGERTDNSNDQDGELNQYSNLVRKLARDNNLKLVDLRSVFMDNLKTSNPKNEEKGIFTTDRVHLNEAGNNLVATELWKVIRSL